MKKIEKIIFNYKKGYSSKKIINKYGDFGNFVLETYKEQSISINQVFCSLNQIKGIYDIDLLKKEIIDSFINGMSISNIQKKYGEYGLLCIKHFKNFYKEAIPKY